MRVKIAALSFLIADVILFLTAGFYLAAMPKKGSPRPEQVAFAVRSYAIVAALLISLLMTVILVWVWMLSLREDYRKQSKENMEALIEGTLQDHGRKRE